MVRDESCRTNGEGQGQSSTDLASLSSGHSTDCLHDNGNNTDCLHDNGNNTDGFRESDRTLKTSTFVLTVAPAKERDASEPLGEAASTAESSKDVARPTSAFTTCDTSTTPPSKSRDSSSTSKSKASPKSDPFETKNKTAHIPDDGHRSHSVSSSREQSNSRSKSTKATADDVDQTAYDELNDKRQSNSCSKSTKAMADDIDQIAYDELSDKRHHSLTHREGQSYSRGEASDSNGQFLAVNPFRLQDATPKKGASHSDFVSVSDGVSLSDRMSVSDARTPSDKGRSKKRLKKSVSFEAMQLESRENTKFPRIKFRAMEDGAVEKKKTNSKTNKIHPQR
jgi:hypothetical protein